MLTSKFCNIFSIFLFTIYENWKGKQDKSREKSEVTEGPIRHRRRAADEFRILIHHQLRQWPSKKVQVNNPTNHLIRNPITTVYHIHPITIQQQNTMTLNGRWWWWWWWSSVHVKRVRPVQIDIGISTGDIGVPQSERLSFIGNKLEGPLGLLAKAIEWGLGFGERGRELDVLVFEDEGSGGGVEDRVVCGFAGDGEGEGRGGVESEGEVGVGVGEEVGGSGMGMGWRWRSFGERVVQWGVGLARDDVLWDLPSAVVGVCYLNSQPILGFKAVDSQLPISQIIVLIIRLCKKQTDATQFVPIH